MKAQLPANFALDVTVSEDGYIHRIILVAENKFHYDTAKVSGLSDLKARCIALIQLALRSLNRDNFRLCQNVNLFPATGITLKEGKNCLPASLQSWLSQYLAGESPTVQLPLFLDALSPFNQKVLKALQKIPFGKTASYREIAEKIGHPYAARAVGNACRLNPFPLVIPCHRVICQDGKLGGFAYGLPLKQALLNFERDSL